jgi:hypothetical protein
MALVVVRPPFERSGNNGWVRSGHESGSFRPHKAPGRDPEDSYLVDEYRVIGPFEIFAALRLQGGGPPVAADGGLIEPGGFSHVRGGPTRGARRLVFQRSRDHFFYCASLSLRGWPWRGSSSRPSRPCATKRCRHLRVLSGCTPSSRAITVVSGPWAARNTMRARSANACAVLGRRAPRFRRLTVFAHVPSWPTR